MPKGTEQWRKNMSDSAKGKIISENVTEKLKIKRRFNGELKCK